MPLCWPRAGVLADRHFKVRCGIPDGSSLLLKLSFHEPPKRLTPPAPLDLAIDFLQNAGPVSSPFVSL
jgi:hypothetical protein